ncbi:TPA: molecular chaperone [Yersinia enterocolitica]|uniref:fimbrial biogenesis chaperone n=1 Tax=Yersinia enterocolitica TaxID=630 RepID=UPI0005E2882C|nr:molecular chaperone [Yersinia enterocolitica]CNF98586.1 putative chaperone protein [Yersinia enterocolitica]CRY34324.1 putative chaperone protein [Yersinia enterocolitica]HDM8291958.1 molecular chaperone [Yersinia enterocolitica]HDM8295942.1 molecular chaperone [Yersinia enterocolitica]HDM8321228.1 molecular chaperone [Yersinia enterocolitica]
MIKLTSLASLVLFATAVASSPLYAASSVLIWPIDPVINSHEKATALWLENKDSQPVYMQIRVLGWQQKSGQEDYNNQSAIIASPPVATILPGKRQLIRLIKNTQVPAGQEQAFRVLIDEIPRKDPNEDAAAPSLNMGLKFQMRYSVPLFIYGDGLKSEDANNPATFFPLSLSYKLVQDSGKTWLTIRNQGQTHARISQVNLQNTSLNSGLMGYVLPGNEMRFQVPASANSGQLTALVNSHTKPIVIPHQ